MFVIAWSPLLVRHCRDCSSIPLLIISILCLQYFGGYCVDYML
jgi:hypothetical protein